MRKRTRIARHPRLEAREQEVTWQTPHVQARRAKSEVAENATLTDTSYTAQMLHLQRTYGNRYVQRMVANKSVHPSRQGVQREDVESSGNMLPLQRTHGNQDLQRMLVNKSGKVSPQTIQRGWFDDAVDWVSDTAGDAVDAVTDTASDAAGWVADTASDAAGWVSDTASSAWDTVREGASDAWTAATEGASSAWQSVKSFAGEVWDGISGGVSGAWDALSDRAQAAWEGVVSAAQTVGGLASDAWEGLKSLGEEAWRQLSAAGQAVWEGIKWFGSKAWEVIKTVGVFVWEKLCFYGTVLWSFISNIPIRLWRLIVDAWEGITGILSWLGAGAAGFLSWLGSGLVGAAQWVMDFLADPSLDKLGEAVKRFVSWLGDGAMGALGWLWDGIKRGAMWALQVALHLFELLGLGEFLSAIWGTIFHLRPLTGGEIAASSSIHNGQVPYGMVWVDEGSLVTTLANKYGGGTTLAVTTMHILHIPNKGEMPGDLAVHELTHVIQYEHAGAIYMAQAIHAQIAGSKYDYGDLTGKHFSDLDREAQAELCDNYYSMGGDSAPAGTTKTTRGGTVNTVEKIRLLIAEMRAGQF